MMEDDRGKEKAEAFAVHLSIFEPYPREIIMEEENRLLSDAKIFAKIVPARPFIVT